MNAQLTQSIIQEFIPRHISEDYIIQASDDSATVPDVMVHDRKRNWLFLIDACYANNPIDENRKNLLACTFASCGKHLVMFSAFPNREIFSESAESIAWGTHAWLADAPDHMIHFNGERFLGPYS